MTPRRNLTRTPGISEARLLAAARRYFAAINPNPDRVGCPTAIRIAQLARSRTIASDEMSELQHIASCSPCFTEYHSVRSAWKKRRHLVIAGGLLAASIAVVAVGLAFHDRPAPPSVPPIADVQKGRQEQPVGVVVDLQALAVTRGAAAKSSSISLARRLLRFELQLPMGSPAGEYLVVIEDTKNTKVFEARITASIRQYVTTAQVDVDLRGFSPGVYKLVLRREGTVGWKTYPLEIR